MFRLACSLFVLAAATASPALAQPSPQKVSVENWKASEVVRVQGTHGNSGDPVKVKIDTDTPLIIDGTVNVQGADPTTNPPPRPVAVTGSVVVKNTDPIAVKATIDGTVPVPVAVQGTAAVAVQGTVPVSGSVVITNPDPIPVKVVTTPGLLPPAFAPGATLTSLQIGSIPGYDAPVIRSVHGDWLCIEAKLNSGPSSRSGWVNAAKIVRWADTWILQPMNPPGEYKCP